MILYPPCGGRAHLACMGFNYVPTAVLPFPELLLSQGGAEWRPAISGSRSNGCTRAFAPVGPKEWKKKRDDETVDGICLQRQSSARPMRIIMVAIPAAVFDLLEARVRVPHAVNSCTENQAPYALVA